MKSEKIIDAIPKLQSLDEDKLILISRIIDSCLIVQALEDGSILKVGDNLCKH